MERLLHSAIKETERTFDESRQLIAKSQELIERCQAATDELLRQRPGLALRSELKSPVEQV